MFALTDSIVHIKKRISRKDIAVMVMLVVLFFATRLTNLLALPIFSDEGIYIHWAKIATYDPAWRFISLTDGKQPLQTWGTIPFIKLMPDQLLLAGRLFSVSTGLLALTGIVALAGYLWGKRAGLLAGMLYIVTPYFLFYDRIALVDSGVNAAVIWIMFLSLVLARSMRLDVAMIFGFVAGVGLLAKSSVALFFALSILAGLVVLPIPANIFNLSHWLDMLQKKRIWIVNYVFLFLVSDTIALALYLVQKFFSPFFHYIAQKNLTFILSPQEWLSNPFQLVGTNIWMVPLYVAWEIGWLPMIFGVIGIIRLFRKNRPLALFFLAWILVPFLLIINFNKVVFPRYLIFFPTFITLLTVYALEEFRRSTLKKYTHAITVMLITTLVLLSAPMWFDVKALSLPPVDRGQYIEGKTAVWGAAELMQIVRSSTADGKRAIVLAEGNFGLIADVLHVFVKPDDIIDIRGQWPLNEEHILEAQKETGDHHVFVVFSHRDNFAVHWQEELMTLIRVYEKPGEGTDAVYLFQLNAPRKD